MEVTDMMVFSAIANEADKGKGKQKSSPTKQQARSSSTSPSQAKILVQKTIEVENKGDGANSCSLSGKTKTYIVKIWKPVNAITSKPSVAHKISKGTTQQPNQSADTLDPPSDMQFTIHEGVYQNLQSKLHGTNSTLRHQVMDLLRILEKRTNWQYLGAPLSGTFYGRMLMEFVIQDKSNSSTRQGFQAHPFMLMKRKCYRHAWGAMNKFGMIVINGNMVIYYDCSIFFL
ncbi:uncharacterized protein [Elaeis guineensis]|uniref:uncharacterized protein isoform X2 n=1 Tax=Elaeis guineensis var. tenera TaxID=51953 RepID=UPI003C6D26FC